MLPGTFFVRMSTYNIVPHYFRLRPYLDRFRSGHDDCSACNTHPIEAAAAASRMHASETEPGLIPDIPHIPPMYD